MQQHQSKKSIIHILWSFRDSGAHIFAVNLANEQAKYHNVALINMNPHIRAHSNLTNRIDPKVKVINLGVNRLVRSAAYHIGHCFSGTMQHNLLFASIMANELVKSIKGADIIHTHLVKDRFIVSKALEIIGKNSPKHVMTDHGGFFLFENSLQNKGTPLRHFSKKIFDRIVYSSNNVVTISDPQNSFWQRRQQEGYPIIYNKIYNGSPSAVKSPKTCEEMGYTKDDFIFVMVARGSEPSKGWELTINAFLRNNDPNAKLMLIGGGSEIDRLKAIHGSNPKIKFTGVIQNPADLIHIADVGVLASTYGAESLPNSIIEYLKEGKPVIGSDIGDIKNMLQIGKDEAGILLPIEQKQIDIDAYAAAMRKMQHDKAAYEYFKKNAINARKQYDMAYCAYRYATEAYGFDVR